jgi:hypothetical protein
MALAPFEVRLVPPIGGGVVGDAVHDADLRQAFEVTPGGVGRAVGPLRDRGDARRFVELQGYPIDALVGRFGRQFRPELLGEVELRGRASVVLGHG